MKERARAMVLASFAADSLALAAHWIYDTDQLEEQFGRVTTLAGPGERSYHPNNKAGDLTHYGDQTLQLLEHLASHGGSFELNGYAGGWRTYMADYQGYMDKASKVSLENLAAGQAADSCGSPSTDLGGPVRMGPLIYCYRDNRDAMLAAVKSQTSLTHTGPGVMEGTVFLACCCFEVLHGTRPREAFEKFLPETRQSPELNNRLRKALDQRGGETMEQVKAFGQTCALKAALPGAVSAVLQHEDDLKEALIETVMAGGDSAARGMAVGMILGAHLGTEAIPSDWLEKLRGYKKIMAFLQELP